MILQSKRCCWMAGRSLALFIVFVMAVVSASSAQQIVPAQEIFEKIESKESVYYDGVRISGDLDLRSLPGAQVPNSFAVTNSTIINATFTGATFAKDAVFWGTTFESASFDNAAFLGQADFSNTSFGNANFVAATFAQPVVFDAALFRDDVSFADARFAKDAFFNEALFLANADFNYSDFDSYSYFASAKFVGDALFSDVDFFGPSDFSAASFFGSANFFQSRLSSPIFSDVIFYGPAQYGLASFSGLSSFGGAVFAGEAGFNLARFSDAADFSGARFQDLALFGLTKFEDIASFQQAQFGGDLNFKGGAISTILMDKASFSESSHIIMNDTDFSRFKAHWSEIEDHVVWEPGAYLALVENYRRLGWSVDQDDCYYQYRRLDQARKGWGWSKAIDHLAWLSCGYGVRPGYAGVWSLLTIFIFALVFWRGDGIRKSAKPLHEPAEKYAVPGRVTLRNALFFSTMIFISRGPNEFLPVGRNRYYVILEGILGWLLLALFLVTLGRVMIR